MSNSRPKIPSSVAREVRQRCKFGCVICGNPIVDYEHMKGWAHVKEHVAKDMTLLCKKHHGERTSGILPIDLVRKHDKNPYNTKRSNSSSQQLYYYGHSCAIEMGSNIFKMDTPDRRFPSLLIPLIVDGNPIIGFNMYNGRLSLNANLYDSNNNLILKIVDNILEFSLDSWDITFIKNKLSIRQGKGDIQLIISFIAPNTVRIDRAKLSYNNVRVSVENDKVILLNNKVEIVGNRGHNMPIGISVGEDYYPGVPCCIYSHG